MASPSLVSQTFSQSAGLTDLTFTPTLSAHTTGDMLELDVGLDGNPTVSFASGGQNGWTLHWQLKNTQGSTTPVAVKLTKLATSESETPPDLESDVGEAWGASIRVYRGAGGTLNYYTPTPVDGTDSGSSANGQGSAVAPGVGSQDFTFTSCIVQDGIQGATAGPSGYGNFQTNANTAAARVEVSTSEKAATASSDTPGAWTSAAEQWIVGGGAVWESASGASQSIAFTLEDVTASFAQTATHPQSMAATLDGVAVSVAQTLSHSQALAATLDDVSASIAQTAQHPQSLAITLDDVDATINQAIAGGTSQAIDFTLDGATVAIAQTASHPQSLAATLDGITVAVAQTAQHPQALAATLDGVSVAIAQGLQHAQALAATLDGISVDIQQSVSPANKDQALAITLDDVAVTIIQTNPDGVELLGGGPGGPKRKKKRIVRTELDKDSYLYRLLSPEVREKVTPEAAEVIEAKAVEVVEQKATPSPKAVRAAFADEGIAYRQAYKEIYLELIGEIRRAQEDEDEEEAIAMALLL